MSLNSKLKYPSRCAFVVKLCSDATPGDLHGRLENLLTFEQHEFDSAAEFVERIETDLKGPGLPAKER